MNGKVGRWPISRCSTAAPSRPPVGVETPERGAGAADDHRRAQPAVRAGSWRHPSLGAGAGGRPPQKLRSGSASAGPSDGGERRRRGVSRSPWMGDAQRCGVLLDAPGPPHRSSANPRRAVCLAGTRAMLGGPVGATSRGQALCAARHGGHEFRFFASWAIPSATTSVATWTDSQVALSVLNVARCTNAAVVLARISSSVPTRASACSPLDGAPVVLRARTRPGTSVIILMQRVAGNQKGSGSNSGRSRASSTRMPRRGWRCWSRAPSASPPTADTT